MIIVFPINSTQYLFCQQARKEDGVVLHAIGHNFTQCFEIEFGQSPMPHDDQDPIAPETDAQKGCDLEQIIVGFLENQPNNRPVNPMVIAREIAGANEKEWRLLMKPLRSASMALAAQGQIEILRKGKVVDPYELKGVYKIRLRKKD